MEYNKNIRRVLLSIDKEGNIIPKENFIEHETKTYTLKYLKEGYLFSKGGNSSVYILRDENNEEDDKVIKISNYYRPTRNTNEEIKRRYGRFINEILALNKAKQEYISPNIVNIIFDDVMEIDGKEFPYYVMEKADDDLKEYLLTNHENVDIQEKVNLCIHIYKGICQLHDLGYYHRDLKPDNILLFKQGSENIEGTTNYAWKVGDLGLLNERNKDNDDIGERIGPIGWLSPEAMNKYLTERFNLGYDCTIDEMSDLFQLGKLFWFIFQQNVPIGFVTLDDFKTEFKDKEFLFNTFRGLLNHSKNNRMCKSDLQDNLDLLRMEYGI